eukprot:2975875-Pyramimonas_sp.AAC.1
MFRRVARRLTLANSARISRLSNLTWSVSASAITAFSAAAFSSSSSAAIRSSAAAIWHHRRPAMRHVSATSAAAAAVGRLRFARRGSAAYHIRSFGIPREGARA